MQKYMIKVHTLSDIMFGSGQSIPEVIDNDIRYDECGLPYMNAKTLKGHLREKMEFVKFFRDEYKDVDIDHLLGGSNPLNSTNGILKFSDLGLSPNIQLVIKKAISEGKLTANEVLDSLTITYSSTKINEEGVAEDHSLRRERMIKKGITFFSILYSEEDLTAKELLLLITALSAIQHLGTHKSKGKGVVLCELEGVTAK